MTMYIYEHISGANRISVYSYINMNFYKARVNILFTTMKFFTSHKYADTKAHMLCVSILADTILRTQFRKI